MSYGQGFDLASLAQPLYLYFDGENFIGRFFKGSTQNNPYALSFTGGAAGALVQNQKIFDGNAPGSTDYEYSFPQPAYLTEITPYVILDNTVGAGAGIPTLRITAKIVYPDARGARVIYDQTIVGAASVANVATTMAFPSVNLMELIPLGAKIVVSYFLSSSLANGWVACTAAASSASYLKLKTSPIPQGSEIFANNRRTS